MRVAIQIILVAVIAVLTYLVVESIMKPIRFEKEKDIRDEAVIERLKDIRASQRAYKLINENYTSNFDTLIAFIRTHDFPMVIKEGDQGDSLTEVEALERGLIKRDTIYVPMIDSLFKAPKVIDSLPFIPYGNGAMFEMDTAIIETGSGVDVPVFEAKAPYKIILGGLNPQQITNVIGDRKRLERYEGLKVGSLEEVTNDAGNWEK